MRIVTYNVQYGRGKDDHIDLPRIVAAIKDADVIALQEVERFWPRSGMVDQPAELARLLPNYFWVYGPVFDMAASARADNGTVLNRRRQFGPMLLSRTPIIWSRTHLFPKLAAASHFHMDAGAVEGLIETGVGPLRFYSLHLSALNSRERLLQLQRLLDLHRNALVTGAPWGGPPVIDGDMDWSADSPTPSTSSDAILLGDFNAGPSAPEYELLVGPKDDYSGRVQQVDGFVDTWPLVHQEEQGDVTWICPPYRNGPDERIDYCFATPGVCRYVKNAWVDLKAQGSDHQPYWVELAI